MELEMAVFFTEELCIFTADTIVIIIIIITPIGAIIYIFYSGTFYYGCELIFSATGCFSDCVLTLERSRHAQCNGSIHSNDALIVGAYYIWEQRIRMNCSAVRAFDLIFAHSDMIYVL